MFRYKNATYFTDWIPDGVKTTVCDISPIGYQKTATGVLNTSAIQEIFVRMVNQFKKMFERKAFLHWYQGEGVEEDDFKVSEYNVQNLCEEYQVYETAEKYSDDEQDAGEVEYSRPTATSSQGSSASSTRKSSFQTE